MSKYEVEVTDLNNPMNMPTVIIVSAKNNIHARRKVSEMLRKEFPKNKEGQDYSISAVFERNYKPTKVRSHSRRR